MSERVRIHPDDNVCVTLTGEGSVPPGHKIALCDIPRDAAVIKYGAVIGRAVCDIGAGEHVHSHNLRSHLDESPVYTYNPQLVYPPKQTGTFMGYPRKNGEAGIRNEIYIIPTVGCVNDICRRLEKQAQSLVRGSLDGIFALTHQFGCSQLGEDNENIKQLLCAIARNPNAAFVLFVGLGCENNRLSAIEEALSDCGSMAFFNCQEVGDELEYGYEILSAFARQAAGMQREPVSLSKLRIGLKCGGSDGYSGLTANPLIGKISDRIVSLGGSSVLTEVPEMFGAEQRLMDKCENEALFVRYKAMIENFKAYYTDAGFPVYENPSPGNRAGGITTLEEKSLGCIEKAGSTPIVDVLAYGERLTKPGVSVLNAPGNDLIAATALAAAGCQLVLFSTGRGTPFSTCTPTVKIATNTRLAQRKANWIDFDAYPMDAEALWQLVLAAADGRYTCKSEDIREIAFFKTGVTL